MWGSVRASAIPELANSFSHVHQLPQLETINLTFAEYELGADNVVSGPLAFQSSILGALASSFSFRAPLKLLSLSLHNLCTYDLTPLVSPPFQTVLKTLRRLRLSVVYDGGPDPYTGFDRWLHFWGTLCSGMILAPMQHSLRELTLHSNNLAFGLSPAGLYFPCLSAISFQKLAFEPSVGLEFFILDHAVTLTRLELIGCKLPIYDDKSVPLSTTIARDGESNPRPTYWEHIWDSFAAELTVLVALHVDERGGVGSECRYVCPKITNSYSDVRVPAHVDAADATALQRLYMTVAARAEESYNPSRGT